MAYITFINFTITLLLKFLLYNAETVLTNIDHIPAKSCLAH